MKNLENYVITLETAKRLYEVVDRFTLFSWCKELSVEKGSDGLLYTVDTGNIVLRHSGDPLDEKYPILARAYTLQKLMEVMPKQTKMHWNPTYQEWVATLGIKNTAVHPIWKAAESPLRALEALAVYLLDNSLWLLTQPHE